MIVLKELGRRRTSEPDSMLLSLPAFMLFIAVRHIERVRRLLKLRWHFVIVGREVCRSVSVKYILEIPVSINNLSRFIYEALEDHPNVSPFSLFSILEP